jgi:hypothetical protein
MLKERQELPLVTRENCNQFTRETMPTSWRCEPVRDLPEPGTPLRVFVPSFDGVAEPCSVQVGWMPERPGYAVEDLTDLIANAVPVRVAPITEEMRAHMQLIRQAGPDYFFESDEGSA